jgi:hypothetical protein
MRFPVNVTSQKRCPVCKKPGPGTRPPATPRPEAASLSVYVGYEHRGRGNVVFVDCDLWLGWDSGVSKGRRSRSSLGAALRAVRREGEDPDGVGLSLVFCSIPCLRQFLTAAVDELERRAAAIEPEVRAARAKLDEGG